MGGRAAERLIFNDLTTGAGNDLEVATDLARRMVVEWGMSEKVGPVTLGKTEEELFLGRDIQQHKGVSEETAKLIDGEVRAIVRSAEDKAKEIISTNIDQLHLLGNALLEHETIHGEDIPRLFDGKALLRVSSNGKAKSKPKRKGRTTRAGSTTKSKGVSTSRRKSTPSKTPIS